jgi:hypothetical protein
LGKTLATLVRRFNSRLSRLMALLVRKRRRYEAGKRNTVNPLGAILFGTRFAR